MKIVAEQYTIGAGPEDLTATGATLSWRGKEKYVLDAYCRVDYRNRDVLTEAIAIEWLALAILNDPNRVEVYDRSLRTVVKNLPRGSRMARVITEIEALEGSEHERTKAANEILTQAGLPGVAMC